MIEIKNKKASFDYFIEDTYECGIVLTGTEIKSIRKGSCNLKDCYARVKNREVFLINMFIGVYEEGNRFNHDERRQRDALRGCGGRLRRPEKGGHHRRCRLCGCR